MHHGTIVTWTNLNPLIESKCSRYLLNNGVLADFIQFHFCSTSARIRLSALNTACIVIGTKRVPLSSYERANTHPNTRRGKKLGRFRWINANKIPEKTKAGTAPK